MLSISYLTHIIENGVVLPFIHLSQFSKDVRQRCYVPLTYVLVVARKCSGMWNNGQHDLIYIWDPICTSNCVTGACCGIGNQLDTQIYMATPENSIRDAAACLYTMRQRFGCISDNLNINDSSSAEFVVVAV